MWTAAQQAELLHKALGQLGIKRPVVVGHSWGTMVALELAAHHQAEMAGLVLAVRLLFLDVRPDVLLVAAGAVPVLGDILRYTISPLLGLVADAAAAVGDVLACPDAGALPGRISPAMALRPSQIRAPRWTES